MRIIIAPYPKPLRNGKVSAKNYPYWDELIKLLKDHHLIQVGVAGEKKLVDDFRTNLSLPQLASLVKSCDFWISVDSFFQHLATPLGKRGVVLWGTSHPNIFGYSSNCNILKSKNYLRSDPFYWWEDEVFNPEAYLNAQLVYSTIKEQFLTKNLE